MHHIHQVYIILSRLAPRSTAKQIQLHVKRETGLDVRVEKLQTKFDTYCSFYIPAGHQIRAKLLSADSWPEGTLVKPFYSH